MSRELTWPGATKTASYPQMKASQFHQFMKAAIVLLFVGITTAAQAQQAERSLKIELPKSKPNAIFSLRDALTFNLVVFSKSVEDQNKLEGVIIDDWRYDEPNYFF